MIATGAYRVAHALWRCLPQDLRRSAFHKAVTVVGPRPGPVHAVLRGPATVLGLLRSTTGLGEGARLCLRALAGLGIATSCHDVSAAFITEDLPGHEQRSPAARAGEGGALIAHINPHMLPLALMNFGRGRLRSKYVIGYWAWELERIPSKWQDGFSFVHEIWVPSKFTAGAFANLTSIPVHVVPHPVIQPTPSSRTRAEFGLPDAPFTVLTLLHMGSGFVRKNPLASIHAFREAFGDDPKHQLVVKIADAEVHASGHQQVLRAIGSACNIHILEDKLSSEDMAALLSCCDVLLSLHRSEGFGLVLASAMRLGKVVVATGWSGNMDFMSGTNSVPIDYKLVPVEDPQGNYIQTDLRWADADISHAAESLRRLAQEPELRSQLGAAAAADSARQFSLDAYRSRVWSSLVDRCEHASA